MALGSYNTFASARLDRPDQSLRRIAIKQMGGQALNASEIDRLARRQGVEARYEQFGNPSFSGDVGVGSGMDSAYARAGAPFGIRARLSAEGSTLGRLAGEYGDGNVGGVQQLARERLLRERELGNLTVDRAKFANSHMEDDYNRRAALEDLKLNDARFEDANRQENYDWAQELRERQRRNWELADRRIADEQSGRNALMQAELEQRQIDAVPSSLSDRRYSGASYDAVDRGIDAALANNDFGAYSALSARRNAMLQADQKARAEADKVRAAEAKAQGNKKPAKYEEVAAAYDFYTKQINEARARGDNEAADFYAAARAGLVAQKGNGSKPSGRVSEEMASANGQPKSGGAAGVSTATGGEKKAVAPSRAYVSPTDENKAWYSL